MSLLDLVAPPVCLACGAPRGDPLCASCRTELPWLRDACPRCALPRPCSPCPARRAAFSRALAAVEHDGPARELVLALKLRGSRAAADAMAAAIAARLPALGERPVVVPVPPARARLRRRGFDPAEMIAGRVAERLGAELRRCLSRAGGDGRQVGLARGARRRGPSIRASGHAPVVAILVDDVHTTGATLDACAAALRTSGSRQVLAATYARTLRRA
jgi:predicted amidophosphoribosyltransferase